MTNMIIPCFYFPTTVLFLDDNEPFLENLKLNLPSKLLSVTYTQPSKALRYLSNLQSQISTFTKFLKTSVEERSLTISVSDFYHQIYDSSRFEQTSVLIVDHDMPEMTGLDFCKKIKGKRPKIIMLTGVADHKIAVEAFNEGIIDRFLLKNDPDLYNKLSSYILDLQYLFFLEESKAIFEAISIFSLDILNQPDFINYFNAIKKDKSEFYLLDESGSFLFLDFNGQASWLFIKSEAEVEQYLAEAINYKLPIEIINSIKNRKVIPVFFNNDHSKVPFSQWKEHLYPAARINKNSLLYCVYSQSDNYLKVLNDKIISHSQYMNMF